MPRKQNALIETGDLVLDAPDEPGEFHADDVQIVASNRLDAKAKEAKFFEERVVIEIEPGEKENDPMYVQLFHNGIPQMVLRGQEIAVKRKFVYSGLMAKAVSFGCEFRKNGDKEINKLTPKTNTTYRMRLVSDPNPEAGPRWWQSVARQATGIRV